MGYDQEIDVVGTKNSLKIDKCVDNGLLYFMIRFASNFDPAKPGSLFFLSHFVV